MGPSGAMSGGLDDLRLDTMGLGSDSLLTGSAFALSRARAGMDPSARVAVTSGQRLPR